MKKRELIKIVIINVEITIIFATILLLTINMQHSKYNNILNTVIKNIVNSVAREYPEVKEEEIINVLNSSNITENNILDKYGYSEDVSYIRELKNTMNNSITQNITILVVFGSILIILYLLYMIKQDRKISEINDYLREINKRNYTLKIEKNGEGEIDKLRNELYKTTVLLKETAENSEKEKEQLSNSLADISHQLKTPLTSMRIMLDNIEENSNMEEKTKKEFIREISKQVNWISSLVISLLKLAKFDAGTIVMKNERINAKELIHDAISNLSILIEIKDIKVIVGTVEKANFQGDYKWQLEAITNILKNSLEHSADKSKIYIDIEDSSLFLKIKIKDEGTGIDKQDLKHIFDRFHKTKNSLEGSIGIGLCIAKTIIEQNNGYIKVNSEINKGTMFEIKYMK